jgi:hypothetical protein
MSLKKIRKKTIKKPPRLLNLSNEGIGKTFQPKKAINPIFEVIEESNE